MQRITPQNGRSLNKWFISSAAPTPAMISLSEKLLLTFLSAVAMIHRESHRPAGSFLCRNIHEVLCIDSIYGWRRVCVDGGIWCWSLCACTDELILKSAEVLVLRVDSFMDLYLYVFGFVHVYIYSMGPIYLGSATLYCFKGCLRTSLLVGFAHE